MRLEFYNYSECWNFDSPCWIFCYVHENQHCQFWFPLLLAFTVKSDIIYKKKKKIEDYLCHHWYFSEIVTGFYKMKFWCLYKGEAIVFLHMINMEKMWNPPGPPRKLMRLQLKDVKIQCIKSKIICFTHRQGSVERLS